MDKTPVPLRACAPIEALDASMYSFVVSKVHTPSELQSYLTQNALGRLLLLLFTSQAAASLRRPLSISSVWHHHVEIQPSPLSILRLSAAQHLGMACANHWIYVKVKKCKISVFTIILQYIIRVRILGMTFYDGIS